MSRSQSSISFLPKHGSRAFCAAKILANPAALIFLRCADSSGLVVCFCGCPGTVVLSAGSDGLQPDAVRPFRPRLSLDGGGLSGRGSLRCRGGLRCMEPTLERSGRQNIRRPYHFAYIRRMGEMKENVSFCNNSARRNRGRGFLMEGFLRGMQ
jgi:hypothetical protein